MKRLSMRVTSACTYVFRRPTDLDESRRRASLRTGPAVVLLTSTLLESWSLLTRGGDRVGYTELLGHLGVDARVDRSEYVVVGTLLVEPILQRSGL